MSAPETRSARAGARAATQVLSPPPKTWLYGPWLDLIVGCGAWSAPLLLLAVYLSASNAATWSYVFYVLALVFNYPHFMATVYRAYHSYDEFARYRLLTVHATLLLAITGLVAHLWYPLLPWIFTLYICWSPWHYTGQNFGLLTMFARRVGLSPTGTERNALQLSFVASFVMLLLSFHTGSSADPLVISLNLPATWTVPLRILLAVFFACASGWAVGSLARRGTWRTVAPVATLVTTQFFWFLLPALIELSSSKEVPQTRYSSGILAVLHSTQYLWVAAYYQKKEAGALKESSWSGAKYLLILVAGGIALFIPGPWMVSRIFHVDFAASFLTFTALVSLHHFILDGAIWKLRDSRIASFLLNKPPQPSQVVTSPGTWRPVAAWIGGNSPAARTLRIATIVLLLLCGVVDRLRYLWAHVDSDVASVQRAIRLNPEDSSAQLRLAQAAEAAGDRDTALAALQRAVSLCPDNQMLQEAYERGLLTAGRDDEAYAFYQRVLSRNPRNVDAWVNFGILAAQRGNRDSAVEAWEHAVRLDPGQGNAQLYLAGTLEQKGDSQSAARHYLAYLEIVSKNRADHAPDGATIISALIKVADADYATGKNATALKGYQKAHEFAARISDLALESLALVRLADIQEHSGAIRDAANSFQQALKIDQQHAKPESAASDWFNYGRFLHRQEQPERLVLACLAWAEILLKPTPGQELSVATEARKESAVRLGAKAAFIEQHLHEVLQEALSLPASAFPAEKQ